MLVFAAGHPFRSPRASAPLRTQAYIDNLKATGQVEDGCIVGGSTSHEWNLRDSACSLGNSDPSTPQRAGTPCISQRAAVLPVASAWGCVSR